MLSNKKFTLILSVIIAFCLWAYVIGEKNPIDSKNFKNIQIVFVNGSVLDSNDLAILSISNSAVDVTVKGTRVELSKVKDKDITASVNLADAALGRNELKINVKIPETVEIEDKSINKVSITVERKKTKEADIIVGYNGAFEEGREPVIVEMDKSSVSVTGAESRVNSVTHVRATIEAGDVEDSLKTLTCPLTPVNKDGEEVGSIALSSGSVKIITQLAMIKTVPLNVAVTDTSEDDILRSVSMPKTVTIKGKAEIIKKIEAIEGEPIDISHITEETSVPITVILPEGVQVSEQSISLNLTVKTEKMEQKEFTISSGDISFDGLGEGLEVSAEELEIIITVKGKGADLEKITRADIALSADLSGFGEGEHAAEIQINCEKKCKYIKAEPTAVNIIIEAE